ncbi:MAG: hypothetical protein IPJ76_07365 [Flavobacteriales bacterium]|nr:MAG: hypothetical protein IPJ76_07365 [Flavobacteriales bacterium]
MESWTLPLSMIPSLAVILNSTSRMVLGLTDELNNTIKDPVHDRNIVTAKLGQIKRLSIASIFMYVSLAVLVVTVLLVGTGWINSAMEEGAMLTAVALFFVAIVYMIAFSWKAYFIRQRQFAQR